MAGEEQWRTAFASDDLHQAQRGMRDRAVAVYLQQTALSFLQT